MCQNFVVNIFSVRSPITSTFQTGYPINGYLDINDLIQIDVGDFCNPIHEEG